MKTDHAELRKALLQSSLKKTSPENILREEIQRCFLYLLSGLDFFKEAVFVGEAALRFVYSNTRYTDCLAFEFLKTGTNQYHDLDETMDRLMVKFLQWYPFLSVHLEKQTQFPKMTQIFLLSVDSSETNISFHLPMYFTNFPVMQSGIVTIPFQMYQFPVRIKLEKEILSDTLTSFVLRSEPSAKNMWDVYHLIFVCKTEICMEEIIGYMVSKAKSFGVELQSIKKRFSQNLRMMEKNGEIGWYSYLKGYFNERQYNSYAIELPSINTQLLMVLKQIEERMLYEC